MSYQYHFFYLELVLRDPDDKYIYAYINVSAIPTARLIEIFRVDLTKDPHLLDGYFLTKTAYRRHKKYLEGHVGSMNLDVFEYCLRQYVSNDPQSIQRKHKKSLME